MTTDYGLAYLRALKASNPTLVRQLERSGKLEPHLASVRKRAARMHAQLAKGWKKLNPYNPRVHRSVTEHEKLANQAAEEMVLDGILPRKVPN
jgi:hypothetical protein